MNRLAILPNDEQVLLSDLAEGIDRLNSLGLIGEDCVRIRSVIVDDGEGRLVNHATQLLVARQGGDVETQNSRIIDLGPAKLYERKLGIDDCTDTDRLSETLVSWKRECESRIALNLQREHIRCKRQPSYNYWRRLPVWHGGVTETEQEGRGDRGPDGPFLDTETGLFANDIDGLAVKWLGDKRLSDDQRIRNDYSIIVEDPRAYFTDIELEEGKLEVGVDGNILSKQESLAVHVASWTGDGRTVGDSLDQEMVAAVRDGVAQLEMEHVPDRLCLHLMRPPNYWFDRIDEGWHQSGWKRPVLARKSSGDSNARAIENRIREGESQNLEFKEWIPVQRSENKMWELLKVACSFSNSSGGTILIGVDDDGEVTGTAKKLHEEYADEYGDDLYGMRERYMEDIRQILSEGIEPSVIHSTEWLDIGGGGVLEVHIDSGDEEPYMVLETREIYVRRNATSRRPFRYEVQELASVDELLGDI